MATPFIAYDFGSLAGQAAAARRQRGVPRPMDFTRACAPEENTDDHEEEFRQEEEDVLLWCQRLWPGTVPTLLQSGVVDYLLYDARCQWDPKPGLHDLESLVRSTVTSDLPVPEDGHPLAHEIATLVDAVRDQAAAKGKKGVQPPDTLPPVPPPRHRMFIPRQSASMGGTRVAAVDDRSREPRGVRSGRLHALSEITAPLVALASPEAEAQLSAVRTPLRT